MLFDGDRLLITGLTGMSGAGKTTACEEFSGSGYIIINCDAVARETVEKDRPALSEITAFFGSEILLPDGTLDRKKLGGIIFSDKKSREALNNIIYPFITYYIIEKLYKYSADGQPHLVLLDAPTLFESGVSDICDVIISVTADINVCAGRIMKRDGISRESALNRLSSQFGAEFYRERSDYCADNSKDEEAFRKAVRGIAETIRREHELQP